MLKKALLIGVIVLTAGNTALADDAKSTKPDTSVSPADKELDSAAIPSTRTVNARLEVLEKEFRFGYTPQEAKISHNYWIRNIGPDTVHLQDVSPGCACTKAPLKTNVLGPGDSTDIEITFSTVSYNGTARKSATIIADVPHLIPRLSFVAYPRSNLDSLTPFVVAPVRVDLDSLKDQTAGSVEVRVKNTSTEPIRLKLVSAPDKWFAIDVPGGMIAPGAEETVSVRITGEIANELINKSFTLEASDRDMTRFTVPIQKTQRWGPTTTSAAQ